MATMIKIRGRIAVYSDSHKLMEARYYFSCEGMKIIMWSFMTEHPDGYYMMVQPYVDESDYKCDPIRLEIMIDKPKTIKSLIPVSVNADGDEIIGKDKRPPASYNNIPTYHYDD